jgi:predicted negative regulator of RcsB-dependent stress response
VPQDPAVGDEEASESELAEQASPAANPGAPALSRRERLAAAAEKRREQRTKERAQAAAVGLDAGERVDDALVRATDRVGRFVKRHFNVMQWVFVGVLAAWIGVQIFNYRKLKGEAKVGDNLGKAAQAALAGANVEEEPAVPGMPEDTAPKFATDEERFKTARASFEAAIALKKNEGSVLLAELGLAGVDLDEGKAGEARARYERVKSAPYAQKDNELRGRALEGIALSHEVANETEAALKAYRELENSGLEGFVEVALLSQARLQAESGQVAPAKETLDKLQKHLEKAAIKPEKTFYLGPSLQALKTLIAPDEPKASDPANLDELQKTLQELSKKMGSQPSELPLGEAADPVPAEPVAPAPQAPAAPAPAPAPETAPPGTPTGQDPSGGTQ